jgi:hypothetical protein
MSRFQQTATAAQLDAARSGLARCNAARPGLRTIDAPQADKRARRALSRNSVFALAPAIGSTANQRSRRDEPRTGV